MTISITSETFKAMTTRTAAMAKSSVFEPSRYASLSYSGNTLTIESTDGHAWLSVTTAAKGDLDAIQVEASKLNETVSRMRGETLKLETKDGKLTISSKEGGRRTLAGIVTAFPQPPAVDGVEVPIIGEALKSALAAIRDNMSTETMTKAHLCGAHIHSDSGKLKAAAAYGAGVAAVPFGEATADIAVTLADTMVRHVGLIDDGDVAMTVGERMTAFAWDGGTLRGSNVALAFPDYQAKVPAHATYLAVRGDELRDAMAAVSAVAEKDTQSKSDFLQLDLAPDAVTIRTRSRDGSEGEQPLDAEWSGEAMSIGFIAKRMAAALKPFGNEELKIEIGTAVEPIAIKSAGRIAVLMPVRL
jgi:DNA polymerase III subunit beta